jgi:DNA phosphorothioation-dependent restriction protein DptG
MHTGRILLLALFIGLPLCAQVNRPTQQETEQQQLWDRLLRRRLEEMHNGHDKLEEELAQRREAQIREWQFWSLLQRFVNCWKEMAEEYSTHGSVNPKKFKAVSKAFHDLERSDGWVAPK